MRKGIIRECSISTTSMELKIKVDGKTERLNISKSMVGYMKYFKKGAACEFDKEGGNICKLIVDGVEIPLSKPGVGSNSRKNSSSQISSESYGKRKEVPSQKNSEAQGRDATAPYNFVPINKIVISAPDTLPQLDCYTGNTGYIDLNIETLTPLYIRDAYTQEEDKKSNNKDGEKKRENPEFFSPQGMPSIPGSSLRGMVRNLVEIASFSRMEYVDDSTYYYRTMADKCNTVRKAYFDRMGQRGPQKNRPGYKFAAGYLFREGSDYYIQPAQKGKHQKQYTRVAKANRLGFSYHWQNDGSCITVSGPAPNEDRKKHDWLIFPVDKQSDPISISIDDLNAYRNDINRMTDDKGKEKKEDISKRRDGDLLRMLELEEKKPNSRNMVPCFYIEWTDKEGTNHVAFGHTAYFRLAYELSVRDHMTSCHKGNDVDFAQAIFGSTHWSAGKVFFEDAKLMGPIHQYEELSPSVLSNPKPTTFQHYLEQGNVNNEYLMHWGSKPDDKTNAGLIRGYKLYWHRKTPQNGEYAWQVKEEEAQKHPLQYTIIKPVKEGCKFKGRIRFENLSDIELGALLFVLDLPFDCAHKLGMGKPLGLGSVKISPRLVITDRSKGTDEKPGRYGKLFENKKWHLSDVDNAKSHDQFKRKFSKYILRELKESGDKDLWENPRLKELRTMLYYDGKMMANEKWLSCTQYMELGKFEERAVLDSPTGVLVTAGLKVPPDGKG